MHAHSIAAIPGSFDIISATSHHISLRWFRLKNTCQLNGIIPWADIEMFAKHVNLFYFEGIWIRCYYSITVVHHNSSNVTHVWFCASFLPVCVPLPPHRSLGLGCAQNTLISLNYEECWGHRWKKHKHIHIFEMHYFPDKILNATVTK